jgi:hypothetical protein
MQAAAVALRESPFRQAGQKESVALAEVIRSGKGLQNAGVGVRRRNAVAFGKQAQCIDSSKSVKSSAASPANTIFRASS